MHVAAVHDCVKEVSLNLPESADRRGARVFSPADTREMDDKNKVATNRKTVARHRADEGPILTCQRPFGVFFGRCRKSKGVGLLDKEIEEAL